MKTFLLTILIALSVISCKTSKSTSQSNPQKGATSQQLFLKSNKWILVSFQGQTPTEAGFKERIPFVILSKDESRISGFTGCNSFGGELTLTDSSLKTGMLMSTKAFCQGVPEPQFLKFIETANRYEIVSKHLVLYQDENKLMKFILESE
jgi:heat shock protein HslJ